MIYTVEQTHCAEITVITEELIKHEVRAVKSCSCSVLLLSKFAEREGRGQSY